MCCIDHLYPSFLSLVLPAWCGGSYIYTECRGIIPSYKVSLSHRLVTHWFLPHHHHLHLQLHLHSSFFFLTQRKNKLDFRLAVTVPVFFISSLGFLELFSNSPLSVSDCLSWGQTSCLTIMRTIWSEWTHAWCSPLSSLALSAFGHLFRGPAYCLTFSRTIWSEWTW